MTARELLRDVAADLAFGAVDVDVKRAAALRALADRLDAEMASAAVDDDESATWQRAAAARARMSLLSRLDAPSGRVMPGKETT